MTIRHLRIFTAVAQEGSMNRAAARLYLSQPTVSKAVKELEDYYGVRLFERLFLRPKISPSSTTRRLMASIWKPEEIFCTSIVAS